MNLLTSSEFQSLYEASSDKVAFLKHATTQNIEVVPDISVKEALYHSERGRKFRPSKKELESGKLKCPYCSSGMKKVRLRMDEHGHICPKCRWSIHNDDLWSPKPNEEPEVRGPDEVNDPSLNDKGEQAVEPFDLGMGDIPSDLEELVNEVLLPIAIT